MIGYLERELDHLLDQLALKPKTSDPFAVDLNVDSRVALFIVASDKIRPVNFYSLTSRRLAIGCSDSWKGKEGDVLFVFE